MSRVQKGFLVIADISGYTAFLSHSELEPAAEQLQNLLDLLVENVKPPLRISRLEGDAVISYALEGSFIQGQTLVDMIENSYVAFRKSLELNMLNNACDCNACQYIPSLDLKFFIHYGDFILQPMIAYTELIGTDVNLIHRLTKNTITEKTAVKAYVAYTQAAADRLGILDKVQEMISHTESYEHIGLINIYVQDMHAIWEQNQSRLRDLVDPGEALIKLEQNYPVAPVLLWDYVTRPELQAVIAGYQSHSVAPQNGGRIGLGTTYQCLDKSAIKLVTISDWEPVDQYTIKSNRSWNGIGRSTVYLRPVENGTRLIVSVGKSMGGLPLVRDVHDLYFRLTRKKSIQRGMAGLLEHIQQEIASRRSVPQSEPSPQMIQ